MTEKKTRWVKEPHKRSMLGYRLVRKLYTKQSQFQKIEVFQTEKCGNLLVLDGCFMLTEFEEFVYHEMIVHIPMFAHPNPERILVIGGGDGGAIRELLKHPTVKRVDFAELDEDVWKTSLKYFPTLTSWHPDPRVNFFFGDGCQFVKEEKNHGKYDVVLVDSTDPINMGEGLFSLEFYKNLKKTLRFGGCIVAQTEDPFYDPDLLVRGFKKIEKIFLNKNAHLYLAYVPTYPSGCWSFTFGSDALHPWNYKNLNGRPLAEKMKLKYYNIDLQRHVWDNLPTFVRELTQTGKSIIEVK